MALERLEDRALLASFVVDSTADTVDTSPGDGLALDGFGNTTLRAAIMEANALAGDDSITLPVGTYRLTSPGTGEDAARTGDLDITGNLTITGATAATTIIDAAVIDRVLDVFGGVTLGLSHVTIAGGNCRPYGGGINNRGTVTIDHSTLSSNYAWVGGALYNSEGTVVITHSTLSTNSASVVGDGGAIYNSAGTVAITDSTISNNSVTETYGSHGGGICNHDGTLTITNSAFSRNSASSGTYGRYDAYGGAIYNDGGTATITSSTLSDNYAKTSGAGIANSAGTVSMSNTRLYSNLASSGAGIYNDDSGTVTLTGTTVYGNTAKALLAYGGGICNLGMATITGSRLEANRATSTYANYVSIGGGIYNYGTLTIADTTLSWNSATSTQYTSSGGGVYNSGTATISRSRLSSNYANGKDAYGGGIFHSRYGTLAITNSTLSGNSASHNLGYDGSGGGLYDELGTATITNGTLSANSATRAGGGIYSGGSLLDLRNTIISGNMSPIGPNVSEGVRSQGHNLIGDTSGSSGWVASDLLNVDPMLGPLADNGGPTWTHALLPGSPAIDAGDNTGTPATDQRGFPRIVDGDRNGVATIDIGAFEYQPPLPEFELVDFDVQHGATERSYVRYLDLIFESESGLADLITEGRVTLTRHGLDGSGGTAVTLGGVLSAVDNRIQFDFGPQGIGGNRNSNVGDGYYQVALDLDDNGTFESTRHFYRLLGDVNGDRTVNSVDVYAILYAYGQSGSNLEEDANGDGCVNALDRVLAMRAVGRSLGAGLLIDD
ncbi:MAG TPA: choice-of-anchor Q domain-containing protein [Thermoguttaceae bacterium]|nr:choice-of-anchor Q domain-containing protein [Thermoguttaceae bacterium]